MHGFYGRILKIDLSSGKHITEPVDEQILAKYLGGKGIASYLLYNLNPPGIDPLSPANCIIFATGPATGSMTWGSSRYGVYTKSPQTGIYSESYAGGRVPEAIDSAGYDAIVITGKSPKPAVLVIHPDGVDYHDAGRTWGMNTYETEETVNMLYGKSGDKNYKSGSVVIGPAGEKLVTFSVIESDRWRSAGRTGTGAVMGSKNLKAILFKGDRKRTLFDKEGLKVYSKKLVSEFKNQPFVLAYKNMGTPRMVETTNRAGAFPSGYWSEGSYDKWEKIGAGALHSQCKVVPNACAKCFIACGRMSTITSGRHAGLSIEGPEYETIYAFGGLCRIDSIEEIAWLNDICDRLGMDTISAGNLCGFAIEASRKKRISYKIDYGDVDAVAELLHMIAKRDGIGDTLARGIIHAAKEWGMEDIAVHVKGLEPPGYDPRVLKGSALAFAVSDRGACHLRATFHSPELTGVISPDAIEGKAALFIDFENRLVLFDTLILCRFYRDMYPWDTLSHLIRMLTGLDEKKEILEKRASDISDLVRLFNIREGLKSEDDRLPKYLHKSLEKTGQAISEEELNVMIREYYRLRGWNEQGIPITTGFKGSRGQGFQ
ncbi:MAG: aldehyde:ferredoxin oxidoreductase [Thermodesulfobacteriota bacterium]|nr:aldehyde:ferredoxin oxidoreductase [Thermodesulfobacteriota bacterium]